MTSSTENRYGSEQTLTCVCCAKKTIDHGGLCANCQAPIELSRTVAKRDSPARFVSVLGPSGAGKTVYLGMLLDMLSKGAHDLRGLPNGPFSVAVQQSTINALNERRFPEKTPSEADNWRWVHCEVSEAKRPKRFVDVVTPDFAGEAIAIEIEHEGTYPTIRAVVDRSEALLVLFDSTRARDASRDEDFFAMKLLSYISRLHATRSKKPRQPIQTPIAVVFTKADSCVEALEDPTRFAHSTLPGLVQTCERHFVNHSFFSAGVVGSLAVAVDGFGRQMQLPLHVEPTGIVEPLRWIMDQL